MWNLLSCKPTPEKGGLLAKVLPKHEHRSLGRSTSQFQWGKHSSRARKYNWDPFDTQLH